MEKLQEIIEKTHEARDLIEMDCHHEAIYALCDIENLLMQLPAEIDEWAHALRDEIRLLAEARQWIGRDHMLAMEKIEQVVARFETINRACMDDEAEADSASEPVLAEGASEAVHWFG